MSDRNMADEQETLTPELKAKWVAALRGGEYVQGDGELYSDCSEPPTYCCLGVLGALCGVSLDDLSGQQTLDEIDLAVLGPWGNIDDPSVNPSDPATLTTTQRKLAVMNDGGSSFKQIADWIEVNL